MSADTGNGTPENGATLQQARAAYEAGHWQAAFDAFGSARRHAPLTAADLERQALSAYLCGRDETCLEVLERCHNANLAENRRRRAVRIAFVLGMLLGQRGEAARASGWLSRAERLLTDEDEPCAEQGFLMLPAVVRLASGGDSETACARAEEAAAIGERFGDAELATFARHLQGRCLLDMARIDEGLALLDDVMISVTSGDLSPLLAGNIYCSVIEACRQVYALEHAREWTAALSRWCTAHDEPYSFTGACMVHRAEIMEMRGAWTDALEEAEGAAAALSPVNDPQAYAAAHYQIGELHRLRGAYAEAEKAYRAAGQTGWEAQPGLALVRLAQGDGAAARAALERVLKATPRPVKRARLLPAYAEVLLAAGDLAAADAACTELETIARQYGTRVLRVIAMNTRGAVALAQGKTPEALPALRYALQEWQRLEAPYLAARVRVLLAEACRASGDADAAALEMETASQVFGDLGATPDLETLAGTDRRQARPHGLTARELEVLSCLAAGSTNRQIAAELGLSVRTVDRHVGNLLTKLDVPSRAAATAFAYEHGLI